MNRRFAVAAHALLLLATSACFLTRKAPPETLPAPENQPPPVTEPSCATEAAHHETAQAELDALRKQHAALEEERTRLSLELMRRESHVNELQTALRSRVRMLDEAIHEVVRTKSKQQTLESRAEAASELAEAEIGLKALHQSAGTTSIAEMSEASQLLRMASGEFEKGNFGGALYLTGQAKSQMNLARMRVSAMDEVKEKLKGEVAFAAPLPLTVRTRTNFREGPGKSFKVLFTLDQGTAITAFSNKGAWVRVKVADGRSGWVHQSLVTGA